MVAATAACVGICMIMGICCPADPPAPLPAAFTGLTAMNCVRFPVPILGMPMSVFCVSMAGTLAAALVVVMMDERTLLPAAAAANVVGM